MKQKTLKLLVRLAMGVSAVFLLNFSSYGQCTQPSSPYGNGTAPANINDSVTLTTCIFPSSEYSEIFSMVSGTNYLMSITASGAYAPSYVTIYNSTGTAVAWGSNPLTFNPSANGTYRISGFVGGPPTCGATSGCHTTAVINLGSASACSGTPNAGVAVISDTVGCSGQSVSLSATGLSTGTGLSYQWQSSPNGTSWSNITGATSSTYTANPTTLTYFRLVTTCGTLSNNSSAVSFNPSFSGTCLCGAYCASNATSTTYGYIQSVSFGSINNVSPVGCGQQYTNNTGISTSIVVGSSQTINIDVAGCSGGNYNHVTKVYIDFNQNGLFTDAGEEVLVVNQGYGIHTGTITVPSNASIGGTRMRIVTVETTSLTATNLCGTYTWGETEDYCVDILPPPPCTGQPAAGNI
jgi:hypothetical protein